MSRPDLSDEYKRAVHQVALNAQERQWAEHVEKARASGRCEFSGLQVHACHVSICDCFAGWGCACIPQDGDDP